MHGLRGRDVFDSSRGLSKLDMQRLSVKLHLACGERSFDELHLQRGVFWACWRWPMYTVSRVMPTSQHVMGVLDVKMEFVNRVADVATVRRVVAAPSAVQS